MINLNEKVSYKEFFENSREVYSWLEDEKSKHIFEKRLAFSSTENSNFIVDIISDSSEFVQTKYKQMKNKIDNSKLENIILYGAGDYGKYLYKLFNLKEKNNVKFADRYFDKIKQVFGLEVISPEELFSNYKNSLIINCSIANVKFVYQMLIENEIDSNNIISPFEVDSENQYFDDVVKFDENEIFLDVGAFDGETSLYFAKKCNNNFKKIYCFEPEIANVDLLKNTLSQLDSNKLEILKYGAWNKKETLKFQTGGIGGILSNDGDCTIECDCIDNLIDDKITFIKMDIEGAELNALIGAENTIMNHKPKLAISIYHKPEDIIELLVYIKSLAPEYKFYLRHYTNFQADTVLYAVTN